MTYAGTTRCLLCHAVLQAAQPGHEADPVSHGLGRCCWDAYRAGMGLGPKPFPQEARG